APPKGGGPSRCAQLYIDLPLPHQPMEFKRLHAGSRGVAGMWERLTRADLERAKNHLSRSRAELLRRHAEELKALEAEQDQIGSVERLIDTFARTYLTLSATSPAESPLEQPDATNAGVTGDGPDKEVRREAISVDLQVEQQISPSFGTPPRLRRLIGG